MANIGYEHGPTHYLLDHGDYHETTHTIFDKPAETRRTTDIICRYKPLIIYYITT